MMLLDTGAWVEYFKGSELGKKVQSIMEQETAYTSAISLAEISRWAYQNKGNVEIIIKQVRRNSAILPLEEFILIEGGKMHVELRKIKKDIGMIDALVYATAVLHNLEVLTCDSDFKGLPGAVMLE